MAQQPFDLYALDPAAKRAMEAEDRFKADLKTKNKFPARPKTGSTARSAAPPARNMQTQGDGSSLTAGYDPVTDRFFRALGNTLGNQNVTENLRFIDKNLLNMSNAENAAFNFGRGEGTLSDAIDIALAAPMAGVVAKPLGVVGRGLRTAARMTPGAERVANLAARVAQSRPVQYMAEARPVLDNADDAIETAFTVTPGVQRRITNQRPVVQGLPAPEQRLGLPAPGPGLPDFAAKPRGGQFYPDVELGPKNAQAAGYRLENYTDRSGVDRYAIITPEGAQLQYLASTPENGWELANAHLITNRNVSSANKSPEAAAREARENYGLIQYNEVGDPEPQAQLGDWLEKALAKYYKTDFGSPNDPLRELAARGLHYDPAMTPELWQREVNDSLMEDPIGYFTVPRHESSIRAELAGGPRDFGFLGAHDPVAQGALMQAAPWLRKQPVTENLYGIRDALDLGHFSDEMTNALRGPEAGIPLELAVRPESLGRMSFAQAAEHVGKINQWRVKEMERAALDAQNNPVTHVFKEYAENNPKGLRWVEMAPPKGDAPTNYDVAEELAKALKYEGDTMGHCVGGYCPDVMSGQSRIFSLRDAKGEPHVTIETKPGDQSELYRQAIADLRNTDHWDAWLENQRLNSQNPGNTKDLMDYMNEFRVKQGMEPLNLSVPYDIKQIKGKQNLKPKDDYLPFVQDFVKSGQWGRVGDFENTGLFDPQAALDAVRATREIHPDQQRQLIERIVDTISSEGGNPDVIDEWDAPRGFEDVWHAAVKAGRGYARGGSAFAAKTCSCDHSLAVR